jgi:hypothetical protein
MFTLMPNIVTTNGTSGASTVTANSTTTSVNSNGNLNYNFDIINSNGTSMIRFYYIKLTNLLEIKPLIFKKK